MNYPWLKQYLNSKPQAREDFKSEWDATLYTIGGKMFAMVGTDKSGKQIVTLKLPPDEGMLLRSQYSDIIPGYYMNKTHWNSVFLAGCVPDDIMRQMVDHSFSAVVASLTKKMRSEIFGE